MGWQGLISKQPRDKGRPAAGALLCKSQPWHLHRPQFEADQLAMHVSPDGNSKASRSKHDVGSQLRQALLSLACGLALEHTHCLRPPTR